MPGPYDFIGREDEATHVGSMTSFNWAKQLRMNELFANPLVIGADLIFNGLMYNRIAGPKALSHAMDVHQRISFRNAVASRFGNASPESMKNFVMKAEARDVGAVTGRGSLLRGTLGRDVSLTESMAAKFGKGAAQRMGFARAAAGLSRFMLVYTALDIGVGVMKSLAEAAGSYERPSRSMPTRTLETGGISFDTRAAQSQRMRAIQAIHNTQLSTRAAMGNEAAFLHMS